LTPVAATLKGDERRRRRADREEVLGRLGNVPRKVGTTLILDELGSGAARDVAVRQSF
jgi:hypothetical protein